MLDALFTQWSRCPPLPMAVQRLARYYGLKDASPMAGKAARSTVAAKPVTQSSIDELQRMFPVMPSAAVVQPMSPEDFRRIYG